MPLDVLITTDRILSDPVGRWLINHLQSNAQTLGIDDAALYYDFPTYSDYETVAHSHLCSCTGKHHRWSSGVGSPYPRDPSIAGGGRTISFASRRRFCAIAASVNSSCAPRG